MNGKRLVTLGVFALLIVSGFVVRGVKAQTNAGPTAPKKAEEQFKNIQVLKGIPADQLIPSMQFITASLGVECDFCHVQGAFEKDDKKPKQTARKMMDMMFAINKENFGGHREVTCYSCHRGNAKPLATPVVMTEEPMEVLPRRRRRRVTRRRMPGPAAINCSTSICRLRAERRRSTRLRAA